MILPRFHRLVLQTIVLVVASISVHAQDSEYTRLSSIELPADLDRVLKDYEVAWKAGDANALADLFTADGFVSSQFGWLRGSEAIRGKYARVGGDLRLRAHSFAKADSVAYIIGAYGYGELAVQQDQGKFVLALKLNEKSHWLIAADLDNSNRP